MEGPGAGRRLGQGAGHPTALCHSISGLGSKLHGKRWSTCVVRMFVSRSGHRSGDTQSLHFQKQLSEQT